MRPRKICVCRSVTEAQIRKAVEDGARDFDAVQAVTGCSTGCGTCESLVRETIERIIDSLPKP
ncbi:MAG: (2Fe-2S)-binding protein [Spirochaetia bacterium]|nr:(2Fe-2S)-binding protein [Spirochaetia bacterium]